MGCFTADTPNLSKSYGQAIQAQGNWGPYLASSQSALAPLYGNMASSGLEASLLGSSGGPTDISWTTRRNGKPVDQSISIDMPRTPGLLSLYENQIAPTMTRTQTAANSAQRSADVLDLQALSPGYVQALRSADPTSTRLLDTLTNQAQSDLDLGAGLNPSETRTVSQSVRAGQAARGMGTGPMDNFAEALKALNYGRGLQGDRRNFASGVLNQNLARYGDTVQGVLGRQSGAGAQAQGFLGQSAGMSQAPDLNRNTQDMGGTRFNANAAAEIQHSNANAGMASY